MNDYLAQLEGLQLQQDAMAALLESWVNINSSSDNVIGLARMLETLRSAFAVLGGEMEEIALPSRLQVDNRGSITEAPLGKALSITKHPHAPIKILLAGHMDTVYPLNNPFQTASRVDNDRMIGPGVADMKGGLLIMLHALKILEQSPYAGKIGWQVLINPDEEIGSPGSGPLFEQSALRHHAALLFEPSFADGFLVSGRKGSANFTIVARGKAAHSGRDFHLGRNAIAAIARLIVAVDELNDLARGLTVNVGSVEGGGPVNIVPDLAICHIHVRVNDIDDLITFRNTISNLVAVGNKTEGITLTQYDNIHRPPKPFDTKQQPLFEALRRCATSLGQDIQWRSSGGVCDGNIVAAAGVPTIDTLGAIGGNIHTSNEYIELSSLPQRTALTALFLMQIAAGEITLNLDSAVE